MGAQEALWAVNGHARYRVRVDAPADSLRAVDNAVLLASCQAGQADKQYV